MHRQICTLIGLGIGMAVLIAQQPASKHPHPQPRPCPSQLITSGDTTTVVTGHSVFPPCDPPALCNPFLYPPGTNFLPTIYTNMFDSAGHEIPNTLPSTPTVPYNLHDGPPVVTKLSTSDSRSFAASPTDDLKSVFTTIMTYSDALAKKKVPAANIEQRRAGLAKAIQFGLDILEGNPLPTRHYNGFPVLHYLGPLKVQRVKAITDAKGRPIGGNVNVHQIWYDSHIESDTAFLDVTDVEDVPWTITYTVDVLNRGHDDFSPFVMYFDAPGTPPPSDCKAPPPTASKCTVPSPPPLPNIAMDQSFFNMDDGTRTTFKIRMAPGKYFNLVYTWGWRAHPPRVQIMEKATKTIACKTLVQWEEDVFHNPRASQAAKMAAIAKISDYAPEKRMWLALRQARGRLTRGSYEAIVKLFQLETRDPGQWEQAGEAQLAWRDWRDRTRLPSRLPKGIGVDPETDMTLLYMNNTIYAEFRDGGKLDYPAFTVRGTTFKVTLLNGDYFDHAYQNVDFGGARGWENQFKSSVKVGGSGCWFTFGRVHWWMNLPSQTSDSSAPSVVVPAATRATGGDQFGRHKVAITFNYEPSRRLRFYQFDPVHHDVAVFSVH